MKIGTLIGWGLAIGGGYFLLKAMGYDAVSAITQGQVTTAPANTNTNTNTNVNTGTGTAATTTTNAGSVVGNSSTTDVKSRIKAAMVSAGLNPSGLYSVDLLNAYYKSIRGTDGPAPEDLYPQYDRNMTHTLDEYWAAMTSKGFSGMGAISLTNPYINAFVNVGKSRNATITLLGSERRLKLLA